MWSRVDVADHHHPQVERLLSAQRVEPRLQDLLVDARGATVDEDARDRAAAAAAGVVQQQAVPVVGLERFECKSHSCL